MYSESLSGAMDMFFNQLVLPFMAKTEALCLETRDLDIDPEKFRREHLYRPVRHMAHGGGTYPMS